mmetsp:Transcript_109863/g.153989  ORF Transcript_109863/g.153989 Transcript_109863/m.153989 type:complete len:364 (+) Transcript_109863:1003-2094(+)
MSSSADLGEQALSEDKGSLSDTDASTLDHDEVVLNNTVVGETTHGGDGLLSQIVISGSVLSATLIVDTDTDSVDLLVDLGSVVITILTGSGDGVLNSSRMPRSDATNSSETSMGLSGQSGDAESLNNTFLTVTLGDTNNINHLILIEDGVDSDLLLEVSSGELNLVGDAATVNLDFHNVSLLLSEVKLVDLGLDDDSDDGAVLLDSVELSLDVLLRPVLGVLGESLLLGGHPVLVHSSLEVVIQVLSPDGAEGSQASGGIDVSDNTDNNDGGSLKNGASLDNFLLVDLGSGSVDISQNVGHASLEDGESGQVDGLGGIILGERSDSSSVMSGSLSGKETQRTVSRSLEFSVRHYAKFFLSCLK